jgi:predicted RecB family nuclease
MEKSGFIVKFYDGAYEDKNIEELCKAPVSAISGVSESDAVDLKKAFGIETVEDLATNKYVRLAQGINCLSECSEQILDTTFESKLYENLAKKPAATISGISDEDAVLLKKAFGIDNIKELAENKYVLIAQTTVSLAKMLQFLRAVGVV